MEVGTDPKGRLVIVNLQKTCLFSINSDVEYMAKVLFAEEDTELLSTHHLIWVTFVQAGSFIYKTFFPTFAAWARVSVHEVFYVPVYIIIAFLTCWTLL